MTGINFIRDILQPNGLIKTQEEITTQYNIKCTFIDYHMLVKSIPSEYLIALGDTVGHGPGILTAVQALLNNKFCNQYCKIYNWLHIHHTEYNVRI
jgi:hypothetical protein